MADIDANKQLVRDYFETVVNGRDVDALPRYVAGVGGGTDFEKLVVDPDPVTRSVLGGERIVPAVHSAGEAGDVVAALQDFTEHVLEAFPDMKVEIQWMVAEGDKVVVRWIATGTHEGVFLGARPTGREVPMITIDCFTIEDGKIVKVESHPDSAGVLQSMGHLPATPLAAAMAVGVTQ